MSGSAAVTAAHLRRAAFVYLRQSSPAQVAHHRESTALQFALVDRAAALGWPRERVQVVAADLGVSAAGVAERDGFAGLIADIAAGRVGIVLALDASRLARNGADWHRLLQSCAITDTLIGDADGVYRPNSFNDRVLLVHKGLISEAESHQLRTRLDGAIRSKAARGALRRRLPVGFVWSAGDGEIRFHPDPAVGAAIGAVFERYAALGSVRRVRLSFEAEKRFFPHTAGNAIRWAAPRNAAIRNVLTNPAYAGAYAYGRSRRETRLGEDGNPRHQVRRLPREEWAVLIRGHHRGFVDWATWEVIQQRLSRRRRAGDAAAARDALARTDAATVALVRRLAADYPDSFIAAVLDREDRRTSYGHRFTARHVGSLRRYWRIPSFARPARTPIACTPGRRSKSDAAAVDQRPSRCGLC